MLDEHFSVLSGCLRHKLAEVYASTPLEDAPQAVAVELTATFLNFSLHLHHDDIVPPSLDMSISAV
jgi:hypothetical protein